MLSTRLIQASGAAVMIAGLSAAFAANAIDPMNGNELVASCQAHIARPDALEGDLCRAYLQGFLSPQMAAAGQEREKSSYTKRASQTRAGQLISRFEDGQKMQAYCLPQDASLTQVIEHLVHDSQNAEFNVLQAESIVKATLARHFPCNIQR